MLLSEGETNLALSSRIIDLDFWGEIKFPEARISREKGR